MLASALKELEMLDSKREALLEQIDNLKREKKLLDTDNLESSVDYDKPEINHQSSETEKNHFFVCFSRAEKMYMRCDMKV